MRRDPVLETGDDGGVFSGLTTTTFCFVVVCDLVGVLGASSNALTNVAIESKLTEHAELHEDVEGSLLLGSITVCSHALCFSMFGISHKSVPMHFNSFSERERKLGWKNIRRTL